LRDSYLGIDPGMNGGWGLLDSRGVIVACGHWRAWKDILPYRGQIKSAAIERIQVRQDTTRQHAFRLATLVENFGVWQGLCMAWEISAVKIVHPRTWQAHFMLVVGGHLGKAMPKAQLARAKKEQVLGMARRLWPEAPLSRQKDDGIAAGLLLAEYLKQTWGRV
jgi:hypothetical protein